MNRYGIGTGGDDEPGVLLVVDYKRGLVIARSSDLVREDLIRLVELANAADQPEPQSPTQEGER